MPTYSGSPRSMISTPCAIAVASVSSVVGLWGSAPLGCAPSSRCQPATERRVGEERGEDDEALDDVDRVKAQRHEV